MLTPAAFRVGKQWPAEGGLSDERTWDHHDADLAEAFARYVGDPII
jgi:hypothetical protein